MIDQISKNVGAANVACVVVEPIQGEGGFIVPPAGFLPALVEFCQANGIVFVADEIQTGFGRTGAWFACEHEGIVPDLITTAKGIAGGLPLAAVTGRAELMDAVHVGGLGGTYGGNPVACAAALAAIESIESQDLVGAAASARLGDARPPRTGWPHATRVSATCAARGDGGRGARAPRHPRAGHGPHGRARGGVPPRRASSC